MSRFKNNGTIPSRLVSPIVERIPTRLVCEDGPRIELPVSLPRPTAPKLAAIAAAVPPLEPAGTRSSAYGLRVYPGRIELTVSNGLHANSAILDLARTTAPASRSLRTWKASLAGIDPFNDNDPAVVGISAVLKLSFTISGTQWSGPLIPDRANCASRASAAASAFGLIMMIALSAGPFLSYASIRSMYF